MPADELTAMAMNRAQRRQYESQVERDRNGAPPPADIAARMTNPKVADIGYQVFADIRGEDGSRPISPKFIGGDGEEVCSRILEAVNAQICLGKLKGWGNTRIERAYHVSTV